MISFVRKVKVPRTRVVMIATVLLILVFPCLLYSQPLPVPQGTKCAECGMIVDQNSKFTSEVITGDNKNLFFCDIGDMLFYFRAKREGIKDVSIRDYTTGKRIDGKKAFYVLNKKISTPMSWGIAAFAGEAAAKKWGTPVDFNGAFTLLK